jgi:hypothetical protein
MYVMYVYVLPMNRYVLVGLINCMGTWRLTPIGAIRLRPRRFICSTAHLITASPFARASVSGPIVSIYVAYGMWRRAFLKFKIRKTAKAAHARVAVAHEVAEAPATTTVTIAIDA